jgi:hypothetical protein
VLNARGNRAGASASIPTYDFTLDGDFIAEDVTFASIFEPDFEWVTYDNTANGNTLPETIPAGNHTLRIEVNFIPSDPDTVYFDVVAPADGRFNYTRPNDNGGSGGYLDGPELFPDVVDVAFENAGTRRNITEATFESTWNDISNNQYIELANDGSTFTRLDNTADGSVTFASPDDGIDTNIGLSRYGSRTTATPQTGYLGQAIQDWDLFANPDAVLTDDIGETIARAIVRPDTITGETLREAGLKHAATDTLLTRHELAEFTVEAGQRIASAETTQFTGDN